MSDLLHLPYKPRFHGNGFTQLYITPNTRLHVWHPDLPPLPDNNARIHDHIWNLTSRVLHGSIFNVLVHAFPSKEPDKFQAWKIDQARVRAGEDDAFTKDGYFSFAGLGVQEFQAGAIYNVLPRVFHNSVVNKKEIVATLMHKGPDGPYSPRVLCRTGETPFQAFGTGTQPPEETLYAVLEEAVSAMSEESRELLSNHVVPALL